MRRRDNIINLVENILYFPAFFTLGFLLGFVATPFLLLIPIGIYIDAILIKKGKLFFYEDGRHHYLSVKQIYWDWLHCTSFKLIVLCSLAGLGVGVLFH